MPTSKERKRDYILLNIHQLMLNKETKQFIIV